jgi:hypothetical protein
MKTIETTTIPPEYSDRFLPYTIEEYKELKEVVDAIQHYIPNDKMHYIWNNHNKILKTNEPTPCSCGSAAAHWKRAVETLRNFVTKIENNG